MVSWREAVLNAVEELCQERGSRVFSRSVLIQEKIDSIIEETNSQGKTPEQTLSRILQELREEGLIEFIDNKGTYRLL